MNLRALSTHTELFSFNMFPRFMKQMNYDSQKLSGLFVLGRTKPALLGTKVSLYQSSADSPRTGATQSNGAEKLV